MHMHNGMNLDNWTTLVLTNAGWVFNFLANTHQFWVFEQIQSGSKHWWSGYLKLFRTKEPRTRNFQIQRTVGTRYLKKT
jgi:hypothetical protein